MTMVLLILKIVSAVTMILMFMCCWIQNVKKQACTTKSIINILIFMSSVFMGCLIVAILYEPGKSVDRFKCFLEKQMDSIRYGTYDSKEEQLIFRATESGVFYLRGMIGVEYDPDCQNWQEEVDNPDPAYGGLIEYIEKLGFYPQSQLAESLDFSVKEAGTIDIQNKNASRKYLYTPECLAPDWRETFTNHQWNPNRILPIQLFGDDKYKFHYYSLEDASELAYAFAGQTTSNEDTIENLYRAYVYDNYRSIPESIRKQLDDSNLETVGGDNQAEVLTTVKQYLSKQKNQSSKDYAINGVMLLRYCGIPARYVEGYYVNYENANSSQILMNSNRHQWAEVYLDGIGFARFETDPNYFKSKDASLTTGNFLNYEVNQKEGQNNQNVDLKKNNFMWVIIFIVVLSILFGVFCIIYHKIKRKKYLYSTNMLEFTSFLCIRLEKVLKYDNVLIDIKRPYHYQKIILSHYGSELYRMYIRFLRYTDEVQFNERVLSEEEQTDMRMIVKRFENNILDQKNLIQRIWFLI